jgi:hypothetical protein
MMKGECIVCGRVKCQSVRMPTVPKEGGDLEGVENTITIVNLNCRCRNLRASFTSPE